MPDHFVKRRQRMIGHFRIHMMFDVIIHVPVDETRDRVHHHGAGVQPMVGDIVGKPAMLKHACHHMVPGAIETGRADKQNRQPALHDDGCQTGCRIECDPDTRHPHDLVMLAVRDEGGLLRIEASRRIDQHQPQPRRHVQKAEEIGHQPCEFRRPHQLDLGVAANDDGVGMVTGVAPPPCVGIADHAETGDLIDSIIHPACLEGGLVAAFMPA